MTAAERRRLLVQEGLWNRRLYTVEELQRALYALGHAVPMDDLYTALKASGWVKLRLIRDRLLAVKRGMPRRDPYAGLRQLVKGPLQVPRNADLPEWEWRLRWTDTETAS